MPVDDRIPGLPGSPEPPDALARLARSLSHPQVTQTGLTTTHDGRWALLVAVRPGSPVPIAEVERAAEGHPVVYEDDRGPARARGAYPALGE